MSNKIIKNSKIFVAGGAGMVGSSIIRSLQSHGFENIIAPSRDELDLFNRHQVKEFLGEIKPDQIFLAAARVGGIETNSNNKHLFLYENLLIQNNVIYEAHKADVENLIFLGSSCVYPNNFQTPIKEEDLMQGPLEESNEGYSLAKICGIKLCNFLSSTSKKRNYFSVMPCNLFGLNDNFSPKTSHVIPALLRKFHQASKNNIGSVEVWGTGNARREFMYVDDLADACIKLMNSETFYNVINVGTSKDIKISQLVEHITKITGFNGKVIYDSSKKEGTMRKVLNTDKIRKIGWFPKRNFVDELKYVYKNAKETNLLS